MKTEVSILPSIERFLCFTGFFICYYALKRLHTMGQPIADILIPSAIFGVVCGIVEYFSRRERSRPEVSSTL
jgi:hypothetical protein